MDSNSNLFILFKFYLLPSVQENTLHVDVYSIIAYSVLCNAFLSTYILFSVNKPHESGQIMNQKFIALT